VDWNTDPDWEWHSAAGDSPEQPVRSAAASRRTWPDGRAPSLRWILVHPIEEYARHNGHADLLRELVVGLTGE